jgi:hypothetical protein
MKVHQPVKQRPVELFVAVLAGLLVPSESIPVHFVIRPPQHRHARVAQLLEKPRDHIHLRFPAFVDLGARRDQVLSFLVSESAMDGLLERNPFILRGAYGMPHKNDDGSFLMPADGFVHDSLAKN